MLPGRLYQDTEGYWKCTKVVNLAPLSPRYSVENIKTPAHDITAPRELGQNISRVEKVKSPADDIRAPREPRQNISRYIAMALEFIDVYTIHVVPAGVFLLLWIVLLNAAFFD